MASQWPWSPSASSKNSTGLCENCGVRPKFQNHDYCSKSCYAASNKCENCLSRAKSQEPDEDGTVITHPYCGIRCYQVSQQTSWPASTIPAPAAAFSSHEPLTLRIERPNTLLGRKISLMMQERWKWDESPIPKLKAIYRINLPGQVYRRFDLALQMNDGCPVKTTYYGGIAACALASDANPTPCTSESCGLCDAIRSSFGNLLHGESGSDGAYGPGLYTYSNPASAYHAIVPADDLQPQGSNFAIIQCRVVAKADSVSSSNLYAGFIDDSGVVFCTQPTAIIPTHVLICNASTPPKANQHAIPVNPNSVSLGSAPSNATAMAGSIGQVNNLASSTSTSLSQSHLIIQQVDSSDTGGTRPKPLTGNKGKGKAQAKPIPRKPQETGSGLASSSKQKPGANLAAVAGRSVLDTPQSGGSNAPQVVPAPKVMPGTPTDTESSAHPPPSYGDSGTAGGQFPHAVYQSNLASPAPGCFYIHTSQAGFIPIPSPAPPGIKLFVLGADGNFYSAGITTDVLGADGLFYPAPITSAVSYQPIPPSTFSPGSAANQGLLQSPAPDPAIAALRAQINPDPRGSPPGLRSPHARVNDDDAMKSKTPLPRSARPSSVSYEPNRGRHQRATRQSSYPLHGHADDDDDYDS